MGSERTRTVTDHRNRVRVDAEDLADRPGRVEAHRPATNGAPAPAADDRPARRTVSDPGYWRGGEPTRDGWGPEAEDTERGRGPGGASPARAARTPSAL